MRYNKKISVLIKEFCLRSFRRRRPSVVPFEVLLCLAVIEIGLLLIAAYWRR